MASTRTFSPLIPIPTIFQVKERIRQLQDGLNPSSPFYEREGQHMNIRALIKLYGSGQMLDNSRECWILKGKVVSREEALGSKDWCLVEVRTSNSCDENAF